MSYDRIIGLNGVTMTGWRKGWSPTAGETITYRYSGPEAKVTEYYEGFVGADNHDGININVDDGRPYFEITYADGADGGNRQSELNGSWELVTQDIYRNIRAHPTFNKDADQEDIENARLYFESGGLEGVDPAATPETTYLKLLQRGTSEFVRTAVILRYTLRLGRRSILKASWKGVDRAWRIMGQSGSPNPTRGYQRDAVVAYIRDMPDQDPAKKQWLKRAPAVRPLGKYGFSLTQDWWFARRWSETLYDGDNEDGNP